MSKKNQLSVTYVTLTAFGAAIALLLVIGCHSDASADVVSPVAVTPVSSDVAVVAPPCRADNSVLEIAILLDLTGSMRQSTSRRPTLQDFEPLLAVIEKCGGEIAIAFISEHPMPFGGRLFVTPLPRGRPPVMRAATAADPFTQEANARGAEAARLAREREYAAWKAEAARATAEFRAALAEALALPQDRPRTHIQASIDELNTFFNEPRTGARRKVLLAVTDGLDNASTKPLRGLTSRPRVIVVNQIGPGYLAPFASATFGDVPAAVRHIVEAV